MMSSPLNARLNDSCARWQLNNPEPVAETPRAHVFRVQYEGRSAALKLLSADGVKSEGGAPALLRHWEGKGAVRLIAASKDAHLLDWLPGPSLGDMARGGEDMAAARQLAKAALMLHKAGPLAGVETLEHMLTPLLTHPAPSADMQRAAALAQALLATSPMPVLLHGDLHHDNILADGKGGWAAIDPIGILGDPAFEFANTFRNPVGMEQAALDPTRAQRIATIFAKETGLPPDRLLGWAAVRTALSIIWNRVERTPDDYDHRILATLLPLARDAQSS